MQLMLCSLAINGPQLDAGNEQALSPVPWTGIHVLRHLLVPGLVPYQPIMFSAGCDFPSFG